MKIVGFAAENFASTHLRIRQWIEAMKARGHAATFHERDVLDDVANIDATFKGADIVVYGRDHDARRIATLLAGRKVHGFKLIVDTDDLVTDIPASNLAHNTFHSGTGIARICLAQYREADAITISTRELFEATRQYNKACYIVPNMADPKVYAPVKFRKKEARHRDDLRIYWGGGGGHYEDLLIVREPILRICRERPNVKVIFSNFVPDWAADLGPLRVFMIPLVPFGMFPKVLAWLCADVGIAPLVDHPHNNAKSHCKYLDYGMARIPGIYQDLPPYRAVQDGLTGLKASTPESWYQKINAMLDSEFLRKAIARNARENIERHWSVENFAGEYEAMLLEVASLPSHDYTAKPLTEGRPIEAPCLIQA